MPKLTDRDFLIQYIGHMFRTIDRSDIVNNLADKEYSNRLYAKLADALTADLASYNASYHICADGRHKTDYIEFASDESMMEFLLKWS